jgi:hypothetical protein
MRRTIRASESSYSALPAFTWRLPITSIASMSTARRTAATKTDRQRTVKPRPATSRAAPPPIKLERYRVTDDGRTAIEGQALLNGYGGLLDEGAWHQGRRNRKALGIGRASVYRVLEN